MKTVGGTYDGEKILTDEPLQAGPNTRVVVSYQERPDGRKKYSVDDWIGCLKYSGPAKTLEEMEEGVRQGALESMKWCQ